jgi:hypothetical protein
MDHMSHYNITMSGLLKSSSYTTPPNKPHGTRTTRRKKLKRKGSKPIMNILLTPIVDEIPLSSPESDYADAAAAEVITDLDQLFTKKEWNAMERNNLVTKIDKEYTALKRNVGKYQYRQINIEPIEIKLSYLQYLLKRAENHREIVGTPLFKEAKSEASNIQSYLDTLYSYLHP